MEERPPPFAWKGLSCDFWLPQPDRWAVPGVWRGAGGVLGDSTRTAVSFDTSHVVQRVSSWCRAAPSPSTHQLPLPWHKCRPYRLRAPIVATLHQPLAARMRSHCREGQGWAAGGLKREHTQMS